MRKDLVVTVAVLCSPLILAVAQKSGTLSGDLFQQQVGALRVEDQSILVGILAVTRSAGLPLSVEYPLAAKAGPEPPLRTVTGTVNPGTVSQVLDRLCAFDPTFTWIRNGSMVNVTLTSLANDPSYFLNRKIAQLTFENERNAQDAIFKTAAQLPGPKEQIAIFQTGMSLDFARPWTVTFKDVTVREVFDRIAQQFGPTYGWEFSGSEDFRMITFHESLVIKPRQSKDEQTRTAPSK
ncbi:MAG TPA: hypothetical protein VJ731_11805 [Terriglobales bacterium]|nr:hypothetical protein [Terriglobales bacterium]